MRRAELASAGVKELLVIAQDITRYGTDFNGEHQLAKLLDELCRLDFHWIRLHYLYPDEITDELIDTIARQPKILPYLDIPIQPLQRWNLEGHEPPGYQGGTGGALRQAPGSDSGTGAAHQPHHRSAR